MTNPIRSMVGWWIARGLPADLAAGDICLVAAGDGGYKVAKILAIDKSAVHVRLYKQRFSEVPRLVHTASLSLGSVNDDEFGLGHTPLSRATFASWRPIRFQNEPVRDDELDGYRLWEEGQGGLW